MWSVPRARLARSRRLASAVAAAGRRANLLRRRSAGLEAVLDYSRRIDGVTLEPGQVRVSADELREAHRAGRSGYLETIDRVRSNVLAYQEAIRHHDVMLPARDGIELGLLYRPIRRVGVCIPGGAAAYPSSLLMTVVPAQAAGVAEIAVVVPPSPFGGFNTDILAACHALGVTEVYRIGGAQGVAALAYGLQAIGLEPVDKIVGPGNLFVALAKQHVFGTVDIDSIAGPSEVVLIADGSAVPAFVAADLISQAEHSPGASILLTWEPRLIDEVAQPSTTNWAGSAAATWPATASSGLVHWFWCATKTRRSRSPIRSRPSTCTYRRRSRSGWCRG